MSLGKNNRCWKTEQCNESFERSSTSRRASHPCPKELRCSVEKRRVSTAIVTDQSAPLPRKSRKEPRSLDGASKTTRKPKPEDRWWRQGGLKISAVGTPLACCTSTWTILPAGERTVPWPCVDSNPAENSQTLRWLVKGRIVEAVQFSSEKYKTIYLVSLLIV